MRHQAFEKSYLQPVQVPLCGLSTCSTVQHWKLCCRSIVIACILHISAAAAEVSRTGSLVQLVKSRECLKRMEAALPTMRRQVRRSVLCIHHAAASCELLVGFALSLHHAETNVDTRLLHNG